MTPRVHEPSPAPSPAPEDASEPLPGVPFDKRVCVCTECGRLVTADLSVKRGCGPTCYARARAELRARYTDPRQLALPWAGEERGA